MDPPTSGIAILEPDVEKEAPVEDDLASTAEESPGVSTSEPETSVEVNPETVDTNSRLAESAIHDQTETMELQPEAQEQEETFNTDQADSGEAAENILPEALRHTVTSSFFERNIY